MYTTLSNLAPLALVGVGAGVLGALLGTGGGILVIPALVIGFDVPMHYAVATSIVSVIATSSATASANVERGTANMPLGMTLEVATSLGAIAGGLTAAWLSPNALETLFAGVLLPTAWLMWRAKDHETRATLAENEISGTRVELQNSLLIGQYHEEGDGQTIVYHVHQLWAGLAVSFAAGNLSGLLGIGGGVFKVPALHLLCGVPMRVAAATSNFMIGVTAAASAFLYYGRGEVRPALTATIVLGVLFGSWLGLRLGSRLSGSLLRKTFSVVLVIVALQMVIRALSHQGGP